MTTEKQYLTLLYLAVMLLCSSACGSLMQQPIQPSKARLGEDTQGTIALKSLPPPSEKVVVAVYKLRDETGQYKPSENGASWSTAVTQGGTSILLKALENSGWFIPIERENVGNLLNERKIIRSSRKQYSGDNNQQVILPPLLYAGVILEGGIVSYDANVITGGAGLRYFGAGASSQYRQDRVTVYLRAISTSNGKILKTVYTSKTILSQAVDIGLFRFVRFGRLLEAETGFTYNEPAQMAVTEAIEKAVLSMIVEGVEDKLWSLKEPRLAASGVFLDYTRERKEIPQLDVMGKKLDNRRRQVLISAGTSSLLYKGDYPDPVIKTGVDLGLSFSSGPYLGIGLNYGISSVSAKDFYQSDISYFEAEASYRLLPFDRFTPFFFGGGGLITENVSSRFDFSSKFYSKVHGGVGFEYLFNDYTGLRASADYNYIMSDGLDAIEQGRYNDFYWRFKVGINFYLGELIDSKRKFQYKRKGTR